MKHLDKWNSLRRRKAALYSKIFKTKKIPLIKPKNYLGRESVYHLYIVRVKKRRVLQKFLKKEGIETMVHYPVPLHLQEAYSYLGYKKGDFPFSEKIADEILSLPLYPELEDENIFKIVDKIEQFYKR